MRVIILQTFVTDYLHHLDVMCYVSAYTQDKLPYHIPDTIEVFLNVESTWHVKIPIVVSLLADLDRDRLVFDLQ